MSATTACAAAVPAGIASDTHSAPHPGGAGLERGVYLPRGLMGTRAQPVCRPGHQSGRAAAPGLSLPVAVVLPVAMTVPVVAVTAGQASPGYRERTRQALSRPGGSSGAGKAAHAARYGWTISVRQVAGSGCRDGSLK